MNKFENYQKAVNFLEGLGNLPTKEDYMLNRKHPDIYLKRMRYFLKLLGNPDRKFKFIHITGTSGKGTVTNILHEILNSAGKNVGSFTSPHVMTSIEKIKIKDEYVHPNEFADIVENLKPYIDKAYVDGPYGRPSYFEIFFAIALIYFQRKKCEWVILEVGCGGKYDATNVIKAAVASVITNIDYDHRELLGKTLEKIATDKAGTIKKGTVAFTAEQRKAILQIFERKCQKEGVSLIKLARENNYQEYNKKLATVVARHIGIDEKYISSGIKNSRLMCRFEMMQDTPTVILDGAHNRSKIKTTIENLEKLNFGKLFLVIGISDNKDHTSILKQIIPPAVYVFFTRFQSQYRICAHPKALAEKSKRHSKKGARSEILLDPNDALERALKLAKPDDLVLVVGSFFLAGELRKHWYPEDLVLKRRKGFYE